MTRTQIHKSLALKKGDILLKEYEHKGKIKKIVFEVSKITPIKKKHLTGKFKLIGYGKRRRKVEIFKFHAKKGYDVQGIVWFSDNTKFKPYDDTDDYYPPMFKLMFNRMKFESKIKFFLLDESEALLYKGL